MSESTVSRRAGGGARRQRKRRHTVLQVVLISVLVLALGTGLSVVYTFRHLSDNLEAPGYEDGLTDRPEAVEVEGPRDPINVLVMGSDARDGDGNNIDGLTGDGERSDTTILMHVSADRKRAYGVSIPRDSMVQRPECRKPDGTVVPASSGLEMFNRAFTVGGPTCTMQTVEQLTGIRLDHFVVVDFNGFIGMVDAIDGVEVCIPEDAVDPAHGINLKAGTREVRGREALNYVRERHKLSANGDIGRMKRQQAFIASMANKVVSAGTLARPDRLFRFLDSATKSIEVDRGLKSIPKLTDLGMQFRDTGLDKVQFITIPFELWEVDRNRIMWTEEADLVWDALRRDRVVPPELTRERITAAAPPGTSAPGGSSSESPSGGPSGNGSPTTPSPEGSPSGTADQDKVDAAELARANGLCA
ncbi:LCP family protein [Nocardioides sp.]|uniref:LCP family protein n=1 Tax=Nocardioides sp. TaxID=35761 RepID=UPI002735CD90|nr:LCP family protein [Nocardioides sp.]MDP3890087.1 LCP family protein [Nocardioides sp.]